MHKRMMAAAVPLCGLIGFGALAGSAEAAEHRLGGGIHYWTTVDDIDVDDIDIDEEGTSFVLSYQYVPVGLFKFEFDLEYFADGFGGSDDFALAPQVYALAGGWLYGGIGIGVTYSDGFQSGDSFSDPFYAFRAGLDFEVLPKIHVDLNANYQFNSFDDIDVDSDSVTLGLIGRIALN